MGKSQEISIVLDCNADKTFFAGQNVTGHVHVRTMKRTKIKGIRLEVSGKAETYWTEGNGDDDIKLYYYGTEDYMDFKKLLIRSPRDDVEMYVEPSVCKFPFSFMLSSDLPQSCECSYGSIRYKAKAVIDRQKKINDEAEVLFNVIRTLDLNKEPPQLREPLVLYSETPAIGCCVRGFIEINATVNRGCFVPGETLLIDGEIANRTNINIKHSKITIYQRTEYWSTIENKNSSHTSSNKILAAFKRPFLRRGRTDSWNNIAFVIPVVSSSRLDGCRIMNIQYFVKIAPTFQGCYKKNSDVSREIVIGDIPLQVYYQPSVVTSQPMGLPVPYDKSVGHMPPATVPILGFDTTAEVKAEVKACNQDEKDLPEIHVF